MKRANHYVAKHYLRPWANDNGKIWSYSLLVSHKNIPDWKLNPLRSVGYHRDLFTRVLGGEESDAIETWFNDNIENPAQLSLRKAINSEALKPTDWHHLIQYLAMQDLRTPKRMVEHITLLREILPKQMKQTLQELKDKLESGQLKEEIIQSGPSPKSDFPIKVVQERSEDPGFVRVGVESVPGRATWLHSIKRQLSHLSKELRKHRWTIVQPARGITWPTSDSPVVKLNYRSKNSYDFKGGWGSIGTEILLPLSPNHMLYTRVGKKRLFIRGTVLSKESTLLLKKLLIEGATRTVFSKEPDSKIQLIRPRVVDRDLFEDEKKQWEQWHRVQSEVEKEFLSDRKLRP